MKLEAKWFGVACGVVLGVVGFVGTLLSLWFGQGQTITLLSAFYAGYSWSFIGSLLALVWGLIYGFVAGWLLATIYNSLASGAGTPGSGG
jgi:hypothetical protein